jgi:ribonucleoside-diphosphate reductase alpha chain
VSTTDGYRRIADLVGQSVEIIAGDGAPALATRVIPTGIKPVYTLRTRSGYSLRLTADHRVLTANRGDVPAGELRDGDRVLLRGAGFGQRTLGREIAEVLGTAVGDGCITGDQGHRFITVGRNERALAERLASSVNSFCSDALDGRARRPKSVLETPTSLRIGTSAAPITALAKRYSVLNYGAAEKRFTDEVFELDRATQAALLRGLFTADGTVADYGEKSQYISLDSTSLALLEQTQLMLLSFGIKSKLYRNRLLGSAQELPGGIYQRQTMHSLRVSRSSRVRFEQEIGFMTESPKAAKLAALNGRVTTYSDRLEDEFLSLEEAGIEPVYDLTEPRTNHFVANGLVVHNCSEYMFLDNTACNLASLNLIKFVDLETGDIDIEAYRHAVRLWTIVLEISVLMAQFPSKEIARLSYDFRTLGLGYANIGTVLMIRGLPYDSDEARAFTSAMTAIMTGESYATSAEMARYLGPFPGYAQNERHMLRVIRNHRRAAYDASAREYEGLSVLPMPLDQTLAPQPLVQAAHEAWDRALAGGELYGYRNAQTTLLAPTGTIGLLMDCDTTGVEPDFALVKFKKLAGGGYFKIANQSIKPALRNLGYSEQERTDILTYVLGTLSLEGAPYINRSTLKERGFTDQDLDKIEAALPGVFELGFAFSPWSLGEETLSHVGVAMTEASAPGFELLRHLGFSRSQIEAANEHICGTMTVEGAPHLKEEHLPVFDTANKCGKEGTRFIHHMGHIKMMAAAQSFLSGAISKTINMPNEATYDDILDAYHQSWVHGLKAMALYRDGSKSSQPLSGKSDTKIDVDETAVEEKVAAAVAAARSEWDTEQAAAVASAVLEARAQWEAEQAAGETAARMAFSPATTGAGQLRFIDETHQAVRRRLPARRRGFTQEARVAGQKVYLRTGEYDDGSLGEIFIDIAKEGAAFRSMINCFAIAVSKGLQYGVPLDEFVDTFTFVRFEPQGMVTGHPNIKIATSMIDYVFRVLGLEYLGRTDLVQNPDAITEPEEDEEPGGTTALFPNWSSPVSQEPAAVAETTTPAPEPGPERPKAEAVSATEPRPAVTVVHDLPARNGNGSREGNGNGHVAINGSGNGHANGATAKIGAQPASALDAALGELMGDAPFCDVCGHITVRNGSCYKCLNCGNSLGCS